MPAQISAVYKLSPAPSDTSSSCIALFTTQKMTCHNIHLNEADIQTDEICISRSSSLPMIPFSDSHAGLHPLLVSWKMGS